MDDAVEMPMDEEELISPKPEVSFRLAQDESAWRVQSPFAVGASADAWELLSGKQIQRSPGAEPTAKLDRSRALDDPSDHDGPLGR